MIIITSLHASLRGENLVISSDSVDVASSLLLDNLVVTATRTPKTLKDVPVVTTLIPASEIKKSDATTIRDLLTDEMPGLEFGFAMSQETALSMRQYVALLGGWGASRRRDSRQCRLRPTQHGQCGSYRDSEGCIVGAIWGECRGRGDQHHLAGVQRAVGGIIRHSLALDGQ